MRDYLNTLERQLLELAEAADPTRHPSAEQTKARRSTRRRAFTIAIPGTAVVAALAVGFLAFSGGPGASPALAVPVLARPAVDVSDLSFADLLARNKVDLSAAREINTPTGIGYVVPDDAQQQFCLIVRDPVDGYGSGCSTIEQLNRRGLINVMSPSAGDPTSPATFVAVLPNTAPNPVVELDDGSTRALPLRDGVATLSTREDATITYRTAPDRQTLRIRVRATHPGTPR